MLRTLTMLLTGLVALVVALPAAAQDYPTRSNHGMLICYEMLDDAQTSSAVIAIEKARTAAMYWRPSKEFEDNIAGGRVAVLGLPGVTPIDGGLPIVVGGKMIGAIGASGVSFAQDAQIARAGVEAPGK